jgi:hypothetical protein
MDLEVRETLSWYQTAFHPMGTQSDIEIAESSQILLLLSRDEKQNSAREWEMGFETIEAKFQVLIVVESPAENCLYVIGTLAVIKWSHCPSIGYWVISFGWMRIIKHLPLHHQNNYLYCYHICSPLTSPNDSRL